MPCQSNRACEICGTPFYAPPSRTRAKFCSRRCKHRSQRFVTGADHHGWRGGRNVTRGYVYILRPDHPGANPKGYVAEHRVVAEETLGRFLLPTEIVHHLNGDRGDNRPENLEVMDQRAHVATHGWTRLSDETVGDIRTATGNLGDIARRFGISKSHACNIRNGKARRAREPVVA